jgi:hypothetical protein
MRKFIKNKEKTKVMVKKFIDEKSTDKNLIKNRALFSRIIY